MEKHKKKKKKWLSLMKATETDEFLIEMLSSNFLLKILFLERQAMKGEISFLLISYGLALRTGEEKTSFTHCLRQLGMELQKSCQSLETGRTVFLSYTLVILHA
mmetsp:Transcript_35088/g.91021  ORF Transcript_35088/g.91021 Transcript_35088/m.91021 type:complete len:104 (+) Transcript_35088:1161-1472(+)